MQQTDEAHLLEVLNVESHSRGGHLRQRRDALGVLGAGGMVLVEAVEQRGDDGAVYGAATSTSPAG
ncbi:MAG: hypothetical protein U0S48_10345 [Solirubrobacteraceae bacterium]